MWVKNIPTQHFHRLGQSLCLIICIFLLTWRAIYVLGSFTGLIWVHTNRTASFHPKYTLQPYYRYGWRCFKYKPKLNVARVHYYISCAVLGTIWTIHPWEHEMAWGYKQQLLKHLWVSIKARVAVLSGKEMSKEKILTWLPWQLGIK
jgi:hypothetical protein